MPQGGESSGPTDCRAVNLWYRATVSEKTRYARVVLPIPLGQAFTYKIPSNLSVQQGCRVLVELGRRKVLGVLLDLDCEAPAHLPQEKIKPIIQLLDETPILSAELHSFLQELARYYLAPIGEVFRLALPALERATAEQLAKELGKKVKAVGRIVQIVHPAPLALRSAVSLPRGRAPELLERLDTDGPTELGKLAKEIGSARSIVKRLAELGLVTVQRCTQELDPFLDGDVARDTPPSLNVAQKSAVDAIGNVLTNGNGAQFLLDGVTASGKTEVYLHAASQALSLGRGVILLVPEIALTPQLVQRFRARLGNEIAVLHSALSEKARLFAWQELRSGHLKVVIGARSALFAPVKDLGLICVDEEHDGSYKQEEGVRYNARDMALLRAHRAGAVCVLGSATPSLSSEAAVNQKRMDRLILPGRAHTASQLPHVELIDLTRFGAGPSGDPLLSLPLHRALEETLASGDQSILFLNRRGFAPSLLCGGCGEIAECPHCSVALTLHRQPSARLQCHYCDFVVRLPEACGACAGTKFVEEGTGTERIESLLRAAFPNARVARLDRDVASGKKSEAIMERVHKREVDILIGTQMVTKGHDLPGVTLVGVLNADAALSLPDFRAAERTFHLLVQVAGRAGRAEKPGRVLIQTRNMTHPAIVCAQSHDVRGFVSHEMQARQEIDYPPFVHIALIRFDGLDEQVVGSEAKRVSGLLKDHDQVEMLGPAAAPLTRLRNRYRYRFLLRAKDRTQLRQALLVIARAPAHHHVRRVIDVDPQSML